MKRAPCPSDCSVLTPLHAVLVVAGSEGHARSWGNLCRHYTMATATATGHLTLHSHYHADTDTDGGAGPRLRKVSRDQCTSDVGA
jgi:hypothetical protein